jgi:hypothetical protein
MAEGREPENEACLNGAGAAGQQRNGRNDLRKAVGEEQSSHRDVNMKRGEREGENCAVKSPICECEKRECDDALSS